jgi:hypothetical protein
MCICQDGEIGPVLETGEGKANTPAEQHSSHMYRW